MRVHCYVQFCPLAKEPSSIIAFYWQQPLTAEYLDRPFALYLRLLSKPGSLFNLCNMLVRAGPPPTIAWFFFSVRDLLAVIKVRAASSASKTTKKTNRLCKCWARSYEIGAISYLQSTYPQESLLMSPTLKSPVAAACGAAVEAVDLAWAERSGAEPSVQCPLWDSPAPQVICPCLRAGWCHFIASPRHTLTVFIIWTH